MIAKYLIYFTRNAQSISLPINPEDLPLNNPGKNGTYNVVGLGDIIVPRTPGLRTVKISSYFPARVTSAVTVPSEWHPPEFYINFFRAAMADKAPILFAPARYDEEKNAYLTGDADFYVVVDGFELTEKGGEVGDFYYDLTLTEYRDYSPLEVQITAQDSTATATNAPAIMRPTSTAAKKTATTKTTTKKTATVKTARSAGGKIVVGSTCIANGKYYPVSSAKGPYGTANNREVKVKRIEDLSRPAPYLIFATTNIEGYKVGLIPLGWIAARGLKKVAD